MPPGTPGKPSFATVRSESLLRRRCRINAQPRMCSRNRCLARSQIKMFLAADDVWSTQSKAIRTQGSFQKTLLADIKDTCSQRGVCLLRTCVIDIFELRMELVASSASWFTQRRTRCMSDLSSYLLLHLALFVLIRYLSPQLSLVNGGPTR